MPKILLLDGGLGTSLEQGYNVKFSSSTPLWSSHLLVSDQDTLLACQSDFGRVPVDIIQTATYQVSVEGFRNTKTSKYPDGVPEQAIPGFIEDSVRIAERAHRPGGGGLVALSLGPYGACMVPSQEYTGAYDGEHDSPEALQSWHARRMRLVSSSISHLSTRVAMLALETIPRVDEIRSMRRARAADPNLGGVPFWMSCLFPGDGWALPDGTPAEEAVRAMLDPQVAPSAVPWGIGVNCTKTWKLRGLLGRYGRAVSDLVREGRVAAWPALVLYPDGTNGENYNPEIGVWERSPRADSVAGAAQETPLPPWEEQVAETVKRAVNEGEWSHIVVGGCCMASHQHVSRLRSALPFGEMI